MARSRIIKPEFFEDPKIRHLSLGARLLYVGMWCQADDVGNCQATPGFLRSRLFPHDDVSLEQMDEWLRECSRSGRVVLYEHSQELYAHIVAFLRHQTINHPSDWRNPPPPTGVDASLQDGSGSSTGVLREGSPSKPKTNPNPKPKPLESGAGAPKQTKFAKRVTVLDDAYVEELVAKYAPTLGTPEAVRGHIETALGHKAYEKYNDKRAYLRNWLNREKEKAVLKRPELGRPYGTDPPPNSADRKYRQNGVVDQDLWLKDLADWTGRHPAPVEEA